MITDEPETAVKTLKMGPITTKTSIECCCNHYNQKKKNLLKKKKKKKKRKKMKKRNDYIHMLSVGRVWSWLSIYHHSATASIKTCRPVYTRYDNFVLLTHCVCVYVCVCVCVRACVRACVRPWVRASVLVWVIDVYLYFM